MENEPQDHGEHHESELPAGVEQAPHQLGGGYLYRPRQLLVGERDLDRVRRELRHLGLARWDEQGVDAPGYTRMLLDAEEPTVPEIVQVIRGREFELERGERPVSIHPNHVLVGGTHPLPFPTAPPRGGDPLGALSSQMSELPGTGVQVAVFDSGLMEGHPWLGARARRLRANLPDDTEAPTMRGGSRLAHYAGHGTFIAGVVLQHAPGAEVVARKVFGADGVCDDAELAAALGELPADVEVANLSLGGYTHGDADPPLTAAAIAECLRRNPRLVVVAAAGNDGLDRRTYPAAFKRVIGVGALGPDGRRACFSNFGSWVDAWAPGVDVRSTFFDADFEPEPAPGPNCLGRPPTGVQQFRLWATWSGTSFAAPRVAGAIAALISTGLNAPEAAFRLVGANAVPRLQERGCGLGAVVNPASYG
jgi:subtilisin family serine protease